MEPEGDFAAWLDRRDATALARVFDATGGRLLLLAAHLAGGGAGAQDLVQATFVAAMARGASWDRGRPLWPWLATILHNESLMQLRRTRRRREVAIDAAGEVAAASDDPPTLAASQEVLGAVLQAIDALPLPYRQVLRLRLVHSLRPVDIARSLEVPVGTVRAQLHRGLEQLRGVLPAGVAGLVGALLVGDGALLAQVRECVLEAALPAGSAATVARGSVGAAGAFVAGGWWCMNGKTIGLVVAGCAVLACLGFAVGAPDWFVEGPAVPAPVLAARAELPVDALSPKPLAPEPDRRLADAAVEAVWPLTVLVRAKDGAPIPDASVAVWTAPSGGAFWNRDSSVFLRQDLAAGVTGADGVFRTSLDALRERSTLARRTTQVWIEARWPHDRPRQEIVALPRTSEAQPVTATIELGRPRGITGRVVDAAGNAVSRASVGAASKWHVSSETSTRADGSFFLECSDEPDACPQRLAVMEVANGLTTIVVPKHGDAERVVDVGTIVLVAEHSVHGRVVLGDGSVLAGMQLNLTAIDPALGTDLRAIHEWLMRDGSRKNQSHEMRDGRVVCTAAQTNTLADGSFRFAGLERDGVYLLSMFTVGEPADVVVRPGPDAVELRIDKQLLTIEVVDERGEPASGAQVFLDGYDPAGKTPVWNKRPGLPETGQVVGNCIPCGDPDGRRIVLSPFGFVWHVGVRDDAVQATSARHEALPGVYRATCRLELREETRFGKLHVVAVDENGAAIPFGASMRALDRDLSHNDRRMVSPAEGWTWSLPAGQWDLEVVLGKELLYTHGDCGFARGFQQQVVTIENGRTTEVKVVARPAGLVGFRLFAASPPSTAWQRLRVEAGGNPVEVIAHDRKQFLAYSADLEPGEFRVLFVTKQALPPGRHTFLLHGDGYQPATCSVDVVADQLTRVRVELQLR